MHKGADRQPTASISDPSGLMLPNADAHRAIMDGAGRPAMLKDQNGSKDGPSRLRARQVGLFAFTVLACITLLQAIIFFGVAGVSIKADAVLLILAPAAVGVAALVLVR
jgi:hypothetical protein